MNPYSVILRPVLSEKSDLCREKNNQYTFIVRREACKKDIIAAVESLFEVNVAAVNTSIVRGKLKRKGAHVNLRPKKKKAVVTLKSGQKLNIFED